MIKIRMSVSNCFGKTGIEVEADLLAQATFLVAQATMELEATRSRGERI
jgi:hypothetical protein